MTKSNISAISTARKGYFIFLYAVAISLLTAFVALTTSAMASSRGGGSVAQVKVNSGTPILTKK